MIDIIWSVEPLRPAPISPKMSDPSSVVVICWRTSSGLYYLFQYEMEVYYLPGKKNFIPDALSRLATPETDPLLERRRPDYTALDDVFVI